MVGWRQARGSARGGRQGHGSRGEGKHALLAAVGLKPEHTWGHERKIKASFLKKGEDFKQSLLF